MNIKISFRIKIMCILLFLSIAALMNGCTHIRPRTHDDLIRYGVQLAEAGFWQEAAAQWQLVLREDPENIAALNNLGVAMEESEKFEEAKQFLEKADSLRPSDRRIQRNRNALANRLRSQSYQERTND